MRSSKHALDSIKRIHHLVSAHIGKKNTGQQNEQLQKHFNGPVEISTENFFRRILFFIIPSLCKSLSAMQVFPA
jgi:hypothetical protein